MRILYRQPPLTGGITATSSPVSSTWPASAVSKFTAMAERSSSDANAGYVAASAAWSAATVEPGGRSTATLSAPTRSR